MQEFSLGAVVTVENEKEAGVVKECVTYPDGDIRHYVVEMFDGRVLECNESDLTYV